MRGTGAGQPPLAVALECSAPKNEGAATGSAAAVSTAKRMPEGF